MSTAFLISQLIKVSPMSICGTHGAFMLGD